MVVALFLLHLVTDVEITNIIMNKVVKMRQLKVVCFGILALFTAEVYAIPVTFTDITNFTTTDAVDSVTNASDLDGYGSGDVNFLDSTGDYVSWTHHYDFVPALDHVLSGVLSLSFIDNETDTSRLSTQEYAFGFADGIFAFGEVDTATYNFDVAAAFLADGMFSVTVGSVIGNFWLDHSSLTISYEPMNSVPEPSTLAILGLGLLLVGLTQFSRRGV